MTRPSLPPQATIEIEETAIGSQTLVLGVTPVTMLDRLLWRAATPLGPRKAQRPCDHGLFDLAARNQLELFAPARSASARAVPDEPG